ncbi:hypothetical protein D6C86_06314 [Aureobasidium pullulans]|uniref:CBF1-interacting co-repressor CIR N-terminal domain-containing protein n=1 Tax=Aureobasidium pullulans TaxID=5580 RepID=A0A4S9PNQ4_AURPU|nr:hypothetical protein D6C94_07087 [Aureobasidium pullulans]THZ37931.1 hypothetical protein D6C87_08162 [Aureobasidium pullulans]THZ58513.1 hypothetical protein D6C86_06314 [Aureobasidium pullulans]THZ74422.1 hypothetical protein D6C88_07097 [Aureobasidium pullulans]
MVLHLLGKKSWNVYNKDNVDRVRQDEAAAQAREEEAERRMQEEDAARRTATLRGEAPPPISSQSPQPEEGAARRRRDDGHGQDRKRRRLRGEDDTDRDMRIAREDAAAGAAARESMSQSEKKKDDADVSITDHAGHIQLFAAPNERALLANSRNVEAEADKAKKAREFEDQFTMRFSNAAGFKQSLSSAPWYVSSNKQESEIPQPSKDVWGNEDPSRKNREQTRMSSNDPMAFMRKAQTQLRQAETDKEKWKAQKERELRELEQAEKEERRKRKERRHKHQHRARSRSVDSLEGFSLDAPTRESPQKQESKQGSQTWFFALLITSVTSPKIKKSSLSKI